MKIGRNEPCFCGSGKKFKHCCLGEPARPGSAEDIANEIFDAAENQPFSSLEELNAFTAQVMNQRNLKAQDEFCGLSPEQMTHLLYRSFTSPETVSFATDITPGPQARILHIFLALAQAIGEDGLKTTATGNLPLKFCQAMALQLREDSDQNLRLRFGSIRSETDLDDLHTTRLVAGLAGLIRKNRGKFVLTRKCKEMLERQEAGRLYLELFQAYTKKFNWGYRDGYAQAEIVQHSFLYTLFLLTLFGDTQRSQQYYEDKFLTAFPMVLEMFPETSYSTPEKDARHCYSVRALEQFAGFFGLAELIPESAKLYSYKYKIRRSTLLTQFVTFRLESKH